MLYVRERGSKRFVKVLGVFEENGKKRYTISGHIGSVNPDDCEQINFPVYLMENNDLPKYLRIRIEEASSEEEVEKIVKEWTSFYRLHSF